jgi:ABC-type sugar transport system permease subunit
MMCFYASFLEGAIIYAHYKFIDPAYFSNLVSITISGVDSMPKTGLISEENYNQAKNTATAILSSKITYIVFEFIKNIFLGLFLGVILNFVVSIKKN